MLNVPVMGFCGNIPISKEEQKELDKIEKALDANENIFGRTTENIDDSVDKEV